MSKRRLLILWLLLPVLGVLGAVPPSNSQSWTASCDGEFATALREISSAISSGSRICNRGGSTRDKSILGADVDIITQTLHQNGEAVGALVAQTQSLKLALSSVAEVQRSQQQLVVALRTELESEKQTKRNLRRSVQDLRSELHTVKEESKAWREHLARLESEIKGGLRKSELAAQEATIEVKSTAERVNSLGEVIRQVQGSLQGLEKTVTRHTANLIAIRKNRGKTSRPTEEESSPEETDTDDFLQRPNEDINCPHPYTRIGLGCFTIHSTERYPWERAREHCKEFNGDLANPYDLYDIVLFLDESFPDSVYSTSGGWGFWIGATLKNDGNWHWVSGVPVTKEVDFWGRGEPGDPLEDNERCLFLHSWWRFRAGADSCEEEKYFICEMKIASS